jgi:hypothetical protein
MKYNVQHVANLLTICSISNVLLVDNHLAYSFILILKPERSAGTISPFGDTEDSFPT